MWKPTLRKKLLFFSIVLAIMPLSVAGWTMIRIIQDELKSSANDDLSAAATQIANEIDDLYQNSWIAGLSMMRSAVDSEQLGVVEKVSLINSGLREIEDMVACQLTLLETPRASVLLSDSAFVSRLSNAGLNSTEELRWTPSQDQRSTGLRAAFAGDPRPLDATGDWLMPIVLPLQRPLLNQEAALAAQINLVRLKRYIEEHPLSQSGDVILVDAQGRRILDESGADFLELSIVRRATEVLQSNSRAVTVEPYTKPNGEAMLGAFSFPRSLDWAIVVERNERDAYLAVEKMRRSLFFWILIGLSVAVLGAIFVSLRISRPIMAISRVAQEVSKGNLRARVTSVRSRDEIGTLAENINDMIKGLLERFNLEKFVSGQTVEAIRGSEGEGVRLGGERRDVTVFFSDIRGFTAFSEKVEPEVVVDMLNTYLRHQAYIVREYSGDIDKYVGDELVAVFQGDQMAENAVRCAVAIQEKMNELRAEYPDWDIGIGIGINAGEVVMGAMGSEERMDYTILGDTVNLGSRLCSAANRDQTLVSDAIRDRISSLDDIRLSRLEPISVKGKTKAVNVFEVHSKASVGV
jgi:adenylate cyclase